jgi:hypothetical protein
LIFVLTLSTISSNKNAAESKSYKELITTPEWRLITFQDNGTSVSQDAYTSEYYIKFSSKGTYLFSPDKIKCHQSETVNIGTWFYQVMEKV